VEAETCSECGEWSPALTAARSAYVLEPPADDLVHALKYEDWPELAGLMGDALVRLDRPGTTGGDGRATVVPVPTTAGRLRARRYNQAELLARRVADAHGLPLRHALVRRAGGRSQTALTPAERRDNVRGAFAPSPGSAASLRGTHVLLVDDVLTTGATASEAASVLADMGARSVTLLTFARALATGPEKSG
jgi:predicted amidophosphoribosyltransferase